MEPQYQHTENGQAVYEEDLNLLGENAALADDRTLAELLRMPPMTGGGTVSRGVMPYRIAGWEWDPLGAGLVQPGVGKVVVRPFRAFIGSRTAVASSVKANWRDIRSAILLGASTLNTAVTFDSTTGAVQRNDLVYAAVTIDADAAAANRKVKDPTTGQITTVSLVASKQTTVALGVVKGADNVTSIPATPTDAGAIYYIPLAVVHIPVSFGGSTPLSTDSVYELCPTVSLAESTGTQQVRPADGNWKSDGAVNTNYPWAFTDRKPGHLPPTMVGSEEILVALDLTTAMGANVSHASGDFVDVSRDWTKRIWTWEACALAGGGTPVFPWEEGGAAPFVPASTCIVSAGKDVHGWGQSMYPDLSSGKASIVHLTPTELTGMGGGSTIDIYVDTTNGALKIQYAGAPNVKGFLWLRASAQYGSCR